LRLSYWDTSCVLALYTPEKISQQTAVLASEEKGALHSSSILEYEMTFAVHAKEVRGEIPRGGARRVLSRFQTDLRNGRFFLLPLGGDIKDSSRDIAAKALIAKPSVFLRTLDGIHLATALALGSAELITADKKLAEAARLLGIRPRFPASTGSP
jgi:predicted nucleic acid-binding protein